MRKLNVRIISAFLSVLLLLSVIPFFTASADAKTVTTGAEFIQAVNDGYSVITTYGFIYDFSEAIQVNQDLTVNIDVDPSNPYSGAGISISGAFQTGFEIAPNATLTINVHERYDQIEFHGDNSALFLLKANEQSAAKLVINGGQFAVTNSQYQTDTNCVFFKSNATAATKKPSVAIANGIYNNGTFKDGIMDVSVEAGEFKEDPAAYINTNSYSYYLNDGYSDRYYVVKLASTFSNEFKKHIDSNGNFTVKRYHPSLDNDYERMFIEFDSMFEEETANSYVYYRFEDYNKENDSALICRSEYNFVTDTTTDEYHHLKLNFIYDASLKAEIDELIQKVTKNPDDPYDFNWYTITDLELVNYWLADSKGEANGTTFLMFSSEFKKLFDYKNYSFYLSSRLGSGDPLSTEMGGEGLFMHNGIVYGSTSIGAKADHTLYVPSETANTMAAKKTAVQKKLDDFLGKGVVTVEETTVGEAQLYQALWEVYSDPFNIAMLDEAYPGHTFEKFINNEYEGFWPAGFPHPGDNDPEVWEEFYHPEFGWTHLPDGYTKDSPIFAVTLNNNVYMFNVECNSSKIVETPKYQSKDAQTNVSVTTDNTSVPFDTVIKAEKLTSGAEYDRVIKALGVKENSTFDITLYSESANEYITKLENGKFQVKLPISDELKGKDLGVYYVASNGKITYHKVTVEGEYAIFETDHFSTYVLSELIPEEKQQNTTPIKSPNTGTNTYITLCFVIMAAAVLTFLFNTKKIKA